MQSAAPLQYAGPSTRCSSPCCSQTVGLHQHIHLRQMKQFHPGASIRKHLIRADACPADVAVLFHFQFTFKFRSNHVLYVFTTRRRLEVFRCGCGWLKQIGKWFNCLIMRTLELCRNSSVAEAFCPQYKWLFYCFHMISVLSLQTFKRWLTGQMHLMGQ